jgi:hypothetical protein
MPEKTGTHPVCRLLNHQIIRFFSALKATSNASTNAMKQAIHL